MNRFKLISGKPIYIENVGYIYQPLIKEIEELGQDTYSKLMSPFILSISNLIEEEFVDKIKFFDLFFMKSQQDNLYYLRTSEESYLELLIQSLEFFLKETISLYNNESVNFIIVGNNGVIDRDNFDEICEIILKINLVDKLNLPKQPSKPLSERQQAIHDKINKHRQKYVEQNTMQIEDYINIVMYGGDSFIPYETIENMTYYQLFNAYNAITQKRSYYEYLLYKTSQNFDVKEDVEHWIITIKKFLKQ